MLSFDRIPPEFHPRLQHQIDLWLGRTSGDQHDKLTQWLADDLDNAHQLARMWVASDYVAQVAVNQAEDFLTWLTELWFQRSLTQAQMAQAWQLRLTQVEDEKSFDRQIRLFRRDMMLRILWRDFCDLAPMTETTPQSATDRKGVQRIRLAADLLARHERGDLEVAIGRSSDYFGPHGENTGPGERVFGAAIEGKAAGALGRTDVPHSLSYLPDLARAG